MGQNESRPEGEDTRELDDADSTSIDDSLGEPLRFAQDPGRSSKARIKREYEPPGTPVHDERKRKQKRKKERRQGSQTTGSHDRDHLVQRTSVDPELPTSNNHVIPSIKVKRHDIKDEDIKSEKLNSEEETVEVPPMRSEHESRRREKERRREEKKAAKLAKSRTQGAYSARNDPSHDSATTSATHHDRDLIPQAPYAHPTTTTDPVDTLAKSAKKQKGKSKHRIKPESPLRYHIEASPDEQSTEHDERSSADDPHPTVNGDRLVTPDGNVSPSKKRKTDDLNQFKKRRKQDHSHFLPGSVAAGPSTVEDSTDVQQSRPSESKKAHTSPTTTEADFATLAEAIYNGHRLHSRAAEVRNSPKHPSRHTSVELGSIDVPAENTMDTDGHAMADDSYWDSDTRINRLRSEDGNHNLQALSDKNHQSGSEVAEQNVVFENFGHDSQNTSLDCPSSRARDDEVNDHQPSYSGEIDPTDYDEESEHGSKSVNADLGDVGEDDIGYSSGEIVKSTGKDYDGIEQGGANRPRQPRHAQSSDERHVGTSTRVSQDLLDRDSVELCEVASPSAPHDDRVIQKGSDQRQRVKSTSARARVAKLDFFSRSSQHVDDPKNPPEEIPSGTIAKPRVKGRMQSSTEGRTKHGPSKTLQTKKPGKISRMLQRQQDRAESDSYTGSDTDSPPPGRRKTSKPSNPRMGIFSDSEIYNIQRAVHRWRDAHAKTQAEVNELIQGHPQRLEAEDLWSDIAAACPDRPRQKIINHCRRKFHNFIARGTWTPEQDEELKQVYELHGPKFSQIAKLVNRHPEDVRDRIRNYLVCGDRRRTDQWDADEEDKLANIVFEALDIIQQGRQQGTIVDDGPEENAIDWILVSEKMGRSRSRLQCLGKWKSLKARLAATGANSHLSIADRLIADARNNLKELTHRDRYRIVRAIYGRNPSFDGRIPFAKIETKFKRSGEKWSRVLLMVAWYRLKHLVLDWKVMTVSEIAARLISAYEETKQLDFPNEVDLDLDAEHDEMELKIRRITKVRGKPRSHRLITIEDDEDIVNDDDEDLDVDGEDVADDQASIEGGVAISGSDGAEEVARPARLSSVDLGADAGNANSSLDEADGREIEDSEPETGAKNLQVATPKHRSTKPTSARKSRGPASKVLLARANMSRRHRHELQPEASEEEQSSSTNASDVESIPAR